MKVFFFFAGNSEGKWWKCEGYVGMSREKEGNEKKKRSILSTYRLEKHKFKLVFICENSWVLELGKAYFQTFSCRASIRKKMVENKAIFGRTVKNIGKQGKNRGGSRVFN